MVIPPNPVIKLDVKLAIAIKKSTMNESMYIYISIYFLLKIRDFPVFQAKIQLTNSDLG